MTQCHIVEFSVCVFMSLFVSVYCQAWLQLVNEPIRLVCADECCGWTERKKGERGSKTKVTVAMHWRVFFLNVLFFWCLFSSDNHGQRYYVSELSVHTSICTYHYSESNTSDQHIKKKILKFGPWTDLILVGKGQVHYDLTSVLLLWMWCLGNYVLRSFFMPLH